ncbi:hypothetical protein VP01_4020g1 [Puccinia sorghi]|uniref:Uncharacterized protein n=1 Tax=Puccinia sorghi TaxID=27349 RepID=A0A0L6URU3_9BASI|nr:hypothetical protein VP01_4020g1 [Puccinia sorghi]
MRDWELVSWSWVVKNGRDRSEHEPRGTEEESETMYIDLNIPWPTSHLAHLLQTTASSRKGKPKAGNNATGAGGNTATLDIWRGVSSEERERVREMVECAIRRESAISCLTL